MLMRCVFDKTIQRRNSSLKFRPNGRHARICLASATALPPAGVTSSSKPRLQTRTARAQRLTHRARRACVEWPVLGLVKYPYEAHERSYGGDRDQKGERRLLSPIEAI